MTLLALIVGYVVLLAPGSFASAQTSALSLSRYLGGSGDDTIRDVAIDSDGFMYVTGGTASTNFPTTTGAYDRSLNTGGALIHDVFVTKLRPDGTILWSTFIGGPNYDRAYSLEIDAQRNVYVAGRAGVGFPTTTGALQRTFGGDSNPNGQYGQQDGFVAKISANGAQLLWSTYFGGNDHSFIRDIALDSAGNVCLALTGVSLTNPHVTAGAFDTSHNGQEDGVIAKLSAASGSLLWATYLGGSRIDMGTPSIRVDAQGNIFALGFTNSTDLPTATGVHDRSYNGNGDLHLAKFDASGQFLWGTYLGGSDSEFTETHGLAVDNAGAVFVAASTKSDDLPTTAGAYQTGFGGLGGSSTGDHSNYPGDGFAMKFDVNNGALLAATYLGGRYGDGVEGAAIGPDGGIYVGGATYSDDFPTTPGAQQTTPRGQGDFFAAHLSGDLSSLIYASFLGGSNVDFGRCAAVDPAGALYVAGHTESTNMPVVYTNTSTNRGAIDGFFARFDMTGSCLIADEPCDDDDPCTLDDRCDGAGGCAGVLDSSCRPCDFDTDCNDDISCTDDLCDAGRCVHVAACADDGIPCNGAETCDLTSGLCVSGGDPCPGFCHPTAGCPCQAPIVQGAGARYLVITPMPLNSSVPTSLYLSSPDWPCITKYLGQPVPFDIDEDGVADGSLAEMVADPAERALLTPAQWGNVVYVTGHQIVPGNVHGAAPEFVRYTVTSDCGVHTDSAESTTRLWGDADGDGAVNFVDVQLVLFGFQGLFEIERGITVPALDMGSLTAGCDTGQIVNINDVHRTILVFQGTRYADIILSAAGACDVCP